MEGEVRLAGGLAGFFVHDSIHGRYKTKKIGRNVMPVNYRISSALRLSRIHCGRIYIPLALWDLCLGSHCSSVGISLMGSRAQNE